MSRLTIISCDSHASGRPEAYRQYLDPKYHSLLENELVEEQRIEDAKIRWQRNLPPEIAEIVDDRHLIRDDVALEATWDVAKRLEVLDAEGIAGELVLYGTSEGVTPFFSVRNRPYPPELRAAGVAAYHRALADALLAPSGGRLLGVAQPGPCIDLEETCNELRWVADHGFVAVTVPGEVTDKQLPTLYDHYFEPFWSTCEELGLKLMIHAGWGVPQGPLIKFFEKMGEQIGPCEGGFSTVVEMNIDEDEENPFTLTFNAQQAMWQLILSGVFDRHPELKLVMTEVRADWVPQTFAYLDNRFKQVRPAVNLLPSEYYARNMAVTPTSPKPHEIAIRHEIGLDHFMFGSDYPHPEGTWPNTREWLRKTFRGVPESEARQILSENAIRIYGFDEKIMTSVSSRIGPDASEVLGDFEVDERLLAHFDSRAGYLKPPTELDYNDISRRLDRDFDGARVG